MKNPNLLGPAFTAEQERMADWFAEHGWRMVGETYDVPDDPDYDGPFDKWDGAWKTIDVFTIHKEVKPADGSLWGRFLSVPNQPTGGEHHWQLLVDLAEASLQRDIEERGLKVA